MVGEIIIVLEASHENRSNKTGVCRLIREQQKGKKLGTEKNRTEGASDSTHYESSNID